MNTEDRRLILSTEIHNPNPSIQVGNNVEKAMQEQLELPATQLLSAGGDDRLGHNPLSEAEKIATHISQKVYMMPESYNALRRELHENWPQHLSKVAWKMAHNAPEFVVEMNSITGMRLQFDTHKVDAICEQFLTALRKKRGLSR